MEEILASIRRIISEDLATVEPAMSAGDEVEPPEAVEAGDDDVLVLRERAPPEAVDPVAGEPTPAPPPPEPAPATLAVSPVVAPAPPAPVMAASPSRGLVDPQVARSAAASLERLYFVVENSPPPPQVAVSASGPTLEDLTRELLRPIIKAWLDEHLEPIVRARVDAEIERIARNRVG